MTRPPTITAIIPYNAMSMALMKMYLLKGGKTAD
jgi:hypothetical protein